MSQINITASIWYDDKEAHIILMEGNERTSLSGLCEVRWNADWDGKAFPRASHSSDSYKGPSADARLDARIRVTTTVRRLMRGMPGTFNILAAHIILDLDDVEITEEHDHRSHTLRGKVALAKTKIDALEQEDNPAEEHLPDCPEGSGGPCQNCGSLNTTYEGHPSMAGYGEDWSLSCRNCDHTEIGHPDVS